MSPDMQTKSSKLELPINQLVHGNVSRVPYAPAKMEIHIYKVILFNICTELITLSRMWIANIAFH